MVQYFLSPFKRTSVHFIFTRLLLKRNYMKKILLQLFFISILAHWHISTFAQDSSRLRISLLTCTPGEELYSTFGHSAYRIIDSSRAFNDWQDVVYNYGTFNFDDDGFYLKFVQGKLLYYASAENFNDFKAMYQSTNRGITEQVLNLSATQKINMQAFLNNNLKEENKYYKYDFFFDNCTTRLRDILIKYKDATFTQTPVMPAGSRFRQAIHQYLDKNNKDWSKLGIDILLGFTKNKFARAFLQGLEGLFFFVTGILGIILIFMWVGTDHSMTKNNFNLIWAWPTHSIMAFFVNSSQHAVHKRRWVQKYFIITAVVLLAVLICWYFLPQQMNDGLIPIVLLLIYLSIKKSFATNSTD